MHCLEYGDTCTLHVTQVQIKWWEEGYCGKRESYKQHFKWHNYQTHFHSVLRAQLLLHSSNTISNLSLASFACQIGFWMHSLQLTPTQQKELTFFEIFDVGLVSGNAPFQLLKPMYPLKNGLRKSDV